MEAATLQAKPFTPFQIEIFLLPSNHKADRQYGRFQNQDRDVIHLTSFDSAEIMQAFSAFAAKKFVLFRKMSYLCSRNQMDDHYGY